MQRGEFVGYCGPLSKALKATMIFVTQRLATLLMGQLFPKPSLLQLLTHIPTLQQIRRELCTSLYCQSNVSYKAQIIVPLFFVLHIL